MLAESDLTLCLPPCTPTFYSDAHKSWSTLDLVFATPRLADTVTKCVVSGGFGSDHRCIDVTIDITLGKSEPPPQYRWRDTDWEAFSKVVGDACETDRVGERAQQISTTDDLEALVGDLLDGYVAAMESTVPVAEKSAFSKRWFTADLKKMLRELNTLKN
ncbi:hypothetical protein C8F04DRAFT_964360, partial [Mycena alexandri]